MVVVKGGWLQVSRGQWTAEDGRKEMEKNRGKGRKTVGAGLPELGARQHVTQLASETAENVVCMENGV